MFEISTLKVYVHDVGLSTLSTISQACDPTWQGSDLVSKSSYPVKCGCHACEMVLGVHNPTSWTLTLMVDISNSGHARALIFSEILYLVGPNKSSSKGMWSRHVKGAKIAKNERSFEKMNSDSAKFNVFLEWVTFLEHSRKNFSDHVTRDWAISPNLCTMTFETPCIIGRNSDPRNRFS